MVIDLDLTPIKLRPLEITDTMDSVSSMHGDQPKGDVGVSKETNIEDIKNHMLFEADPYSREFDVPTKEIHLEVEYQRLDPSITPIKECQYKASKFW